MEKKKWIQVTNKKTYLFLFVIPFSLIGLFVGISNLNIEVCMTSILVAIIGIYLFLRYNSYSEWMNPHHPH